MDPSTAPAPRPLRERLRDADPGIRLGAAAEAWSREASPAELRGELAALLDDPLEDARKVAALALGRIGPPAFDDLERALAPSQPPAVRAFACQAAASHGTAAARLAAPLASCLESPDGNLRGAAAALLPRLGPEAAPHVVRLLEARSSSAETLAAAADAAGRLGREAEDAAGALRRLGGHSDPRVAAAAAEALGRVTGRPASALPALVSLSRSQDETTRADAVRRIGTLRRDGHGAEREVLERAFDASPKVRAAAAIALALVGAGERELCDTLGKLLGDPEPDVRVAAAAAAGHAKETCRPLLPRLESLRTHPDPGTAAAASAASDAVAGRDGLAGR